MPAAGLAQVPRRGLKTIDFVSLRLDVALAHIPVMLPEVVAALAPKAGETYVDCTAGLGGHASAIAAMIKAAAWDESQGCGATVGLCDLDWGNLERAGGAVSRAGDGSVRLIAMQGNFAQVPYELERRGVKADMLLADFGFASPQVDDAAREIGRAHV